MRYKKHMSHKHGSMVVGNSVDLSLCGICQPEIRADVVVNKVKTKRLWGQVRSCYGEPISNALVKLVKIVCDCHGTHYQGIGHTVTDCEGFYQFDVCDDRSNYKVIIGKSVIGGEAIIDTQGGNCNPCGCNAYNPCAPQHNEIIEYAPINCDHHQGHDFEYECSYNPHKHSNDSFLYKKDGKEDLSEKSSYYNYLGRY